MSYNKNFWRSKVATEITVRPDEEQFMNCVTYHYTDVVCWNNKKIVLNSNGYRTATTKRRMNQASEQFGLGYRVFQKDYEWYVEHRGKVYDFYDGITLRRH